MSAYLRSTHAAADRIPGAEMVSLSGGCHGIAVPLYLGCTLILARDPDLGDGAWSGTWAAWLIDGNGEHASPTVDFGFVRPRDYADLPDLAARAIAAEVTR